jgi:signal recognition particle receptor subunit alpha
VYEKLLAKNVAYVPDLLELVSKMVVKEYSEYLPSRGGVPAKVSMLPREDFEGKYQLVLEESIRRAEKRKGNAKQPAEFWGTKKGQDLIKNKGATPEPAHVKEGKYSPDDPPLISAKKISKIELAAQKRAQKAAEKALKGDKKTKTPDWHKDKKVSIKDVNKSQQTDDDDEEDQNAVNIDKINFDDSDSDSDDLIDDDDVDSEETTNSSSSSASSGFGLFKFIKGLTQKELTAENLKPVMDDIRSHLITKNVASEIAESICESVSQSLIGQTHGNFKSISATVKAAMADALTRILTPKRHIDISREIEAAKDGGRPYTIVFVGVNGVGKSTSLAKVCAWLLKQNHRVMIAACDTFRSGAVEQLKVHSKALGGVPIFESGYGKDAAYIAQQAIAKANTDAIDVVLIDTAGRMQDNEPLMHALAKLVKVNNPDLILFVGEALVGNASVDQLTKFNRAFEEYGDLVTPRNIDGILLTKFDTVDDKVGAAISMVYTTGQPIVFVGVGQTYSDLRTLNVKKIVDILARGRS